MSKLSEINALKQRLDTFLPRLKQRVEEVGADAKKEAADLVAAGTDHDSQMNYQSFVSTMTAQINQVASKAERTFQQQFSRFANVDDEDVEDIYDTCEEKVDMFVQWVKTYVDNLFNASAGLEAERNYNKAVQDYKEAAAKFTCTQCSAPVPVPEMYYTSQYLTCLGCGTQSNFQPSTDMQALPVYAEDLARARTADLREAAEKMANRSTPVGEWAAAMVDVQVREFSELNKLLPVYGAQRFDLYKGGVYSDLFEKDYVTTEPVGYRDEDLGYVNFLGNFNTTLRDMRAEGDPLAVSLAEETVKMIARPGDPMAEAVLAGTLTRDDFMRYANEAMAKPVYDSNPFSF